MRRAIARCLLDGCIPLSAQSFAAARAVTAAGQHQHLHQQQQHCCQAQPPSQRDTAALRDRTWDASCSSDGTVQQPQQGQQQAWSSSTAWHTTAGFAWQHQLQHPAHQQQQQQQPLRSSPLQQLPQSRRCYSSRPQVNPTMPPELASAIVEHAAIKAERPPAPPLEPRPLQFESRRSGVIAIKAGMMQDWDEYGARVPLTVLWIDECMVLRHKHMERDNVTSLVLACGAKRPKQLHPRQLGEFQAAGLPLKRKLWECKVTEDAIMPPGTLIGASHFRAGQYLDITGTTKGKGFAGVMKRWNFAGQNATHGNTKHHRAPGSIGGRTDPGRVWKGKKMPGRLGGEVQTFKNIWLYKVDPERNLLYVRGQVPGPQGSFVLVRDAFRWKWAARQAAELPFPTHIGAPPPVTVAKRDGPDPYRVYREDIGYSEVNWKGD